MVYCDIKWQLYTKTSFDSKVSSKDMHSGLKQLIQKQLKVYSAITLDALSPLS